MIFQAIIKKKRVKREEIVVATKAFAEKDYALDDDDAVAAASVVDAFRVCSNDE